MLLVYHGFNFNRAATADDLHGGGKGEQSMILVLGTAMERVMVNQGLPAFVLIPSVVRKKRETDILPINQSLHRRQTKADCV